MTKQLTLQQIQRMQAAATAKLDLLNDTKHRLTQEICAALVRAHEEGKDLTGVSFDLVFAAETAPVVYADKKPDKQSPKKSSKR